MKTGFVSLFRDNCYFFRGIHIPQIFVLAMLSVLAPVSSPGATAPTNFFKANLLPPTNGMFSSPQAWFAYYANGVIISNCALRNFTQGILPPIPGAPQTHNFSSFIELEISMDGGATWQSVVVTNAGVTVQMGWNSTAGGSSLYTNNMRALNASGSGLPTGVRIRQSTMSPSLGLTRIATSPGSYMISTFLDIYTELSIDNGATWAPPSSPAHMQLKPDPARVVDAPAPRPVFPMPNGQYMSFTPWRQSYANGIVIKDMKQKFFTGWIEPPTWHVTSTLGYGAQLDFQLSTDGGLGFTPARAPATMIVTTKNVREFMGRSTYETEVTQFDVAGGDLPAGILFRQSPTRQSKGGTSSLAGGGGSGAGGGAAISSFFDIFTETSTDGGLTWTAATNGPIHLELRRIAPVYTFTNNLFPAPGGQYIGSQQPCASYANDIVVTNIVLRGFTTTNPPPLPGFTTNCTFDAQAELDISYFGTPVYTHASAPATVTMQFSTRLGGDGTTGYYDLEITQLSLWGGNLLAGVQFRESPTRASLGRTTASAIAGGTGGYQIDSFFDLFTEVSTDGGQTWLPSLAGPATMTLEPTPAITITIKRQGTNVVLTWPRGTLQSSGDINGTYSNVPGSVSPFTNSPAGAQQFYRAKIQ